MVTSEERSYTLNTVCHFLYRKGTYISLNEIETHKFIKIKKPKKTMFSRFGFGNKNANINKKYRAFFDENFIYFLKDIEVDNKDKSLRKVGNCFNLYKIYNAFFDPSEDKKKWNIKLEFLTEKNNVNIIKEMIFEKDDAEYFYTVINVYFKKLNMKMSDQNDNKAQ